jgi:hypothetical protein
VKLQRAKDLLYFSLISNSTSYKRGWITATYLVNLAKREFIIMWYNQQVLKLFLRKQLLDFEKNITWFSIRKIKYAIVLMFIKLAFPQNLLFCYLDLQQQNIWDQISCPIVKYMHTKKKKTCYQRMNVVFINTIRKAIKKKCIRRTKDCFQSPRRRFFYGLWVRWRWVYSEKM